MTVLGVSVAGKSSNQPECLLGALLIRRATGSIAGRKSPKPLNVLLSAATLPFWFALVRLSYVPTVSWLTAVMCSISDSLASRACWWASVQAELRSRPRDRYVIRARASVKKWKFDFKEIYDHIVSVWFKIPLKNENKYLLKISRAIIQVYAIESVGKKEWMLNLI